MRPQLVLLGTRGLSGLQRQLAGSVSIKVARYAPTSVLVAHTPGPIRRILLGYDASPDADEALALVAALPLKADVLMTVCSAYEVAIPLSSGVAPTMVEEVRVAYADCLRWAREAADVMAADAVRRLIEQGVIATARTAPAMWWSGVKSRWPRAWTRCSAADGGSSPPPPIVAPVGAIPRIRGGWMLGDFILRVTTPRIRSTLVDTAQVGSDRAASSSWSSTPLAASVGRSGRSTGSTPSTQWYSRGCQRGCQTALRRPR